MWVTKMPYDRRFSNLVFAHEFIMDKLTTQYERKVYDTLSLFGELGGVFELFLLIFGFFLEPWATFSFQLKVLNRLYTVRTNN